MLNITNVICRHIECVIVTYARKFEDGGDVIASEESLVGEPVLYSCVRCNMAPTNVYSN